jgi:hypothetical protein
VIRSSFIWGYDESFESSIKEEMIAFMKFVFFLRKLPISNKRIEEEDEIYFEDF